MGISIFCASPGIPPTKQTHHKFAPLS
uniref:Uncharacterized protein n=1 Tax=Rhizophora mucronata TaxID=61149 RepID=A0A2P2IZD1_RHIMU